MVPNNTIMGCCSSSSVRRYINPLAYGQDHSLANDLTFGNVTVKVALKMPHGTEYLEFDKGEFVLKTDIHDWLHSLFLNKKMTYYINYNDDRENKPCSGSGGHCKGCVAWNDDEIVWLLHSVPNFTIHLLEDGTFCSEKTVLHKGEHMYGQSFVFVSGIDRSELPALLAELSIMHPSVDKEFSNSILLTDLRDTKSHETVSHYVLSHGLEHLSKSPKTHIDIFSDYIQPTYGGIWICETWIRGHHCPVSPVVFDNKNITFENITYTNSHDHSKYACNQEEWVFIGDLNRMTSQYSRGGGGFMIKNAPLARAIRSLMVTL